MNVILATAVEVLAALFALGACVGALVNLGVYRLAWEPQAISPWSAPPAGAPPRRWYDRIPILGWLGLRRESALHGRGFWVRPMVVEVFCGAGFAALYGWEIGRQALILPGVPAPAPVVLHAQYVAHLTLISLMLVGSLIDVDERIIPDTVTLPGTWFALVAAAVYPGSLLPDVARHVNVGVLGHWTGPPPLAPEYAFLRLTSPNPWPGWLDGFPHLRPLGIALGCWWLWCFAVMRRTWYDRHGFGRALGLCLARLRREATSWRMLMGLIGSAVILGAWVGRGEHWAGLLTALVGMAASGGIIWVIRIIGSAVLGREAMGFGDVTLMAMIGAFLGWQPCLIVFFLAPFAGLVVGLTGWILGRGSAIPYGPYLCLAAVVVIIEWSPLWEWSAPIFGLGWFLVVVIFCCLILMVPLLVVMRVIREAFSSSKQRADGS